MRSRIAFWSIIDFRQCPLWHLDPPTLQMLPESCPFERNLSRSAWTLNFWSRESFTWSTSPAQRGLGAPRSSGPRFGGVYLKMRSPLSKSSRVRCCQALVNSDCRSSSRTSSSDTEYDPKRRDATRWSASASHTVSVVRRPGKWILRPKSKRIISVVHFEKK